MLKRMAIYAFIFLTVVSSTSHAQTGLKGCRLTSQTVTLTKSPKPLRLSGVLWNEGKNEYRLKVNSDLKVNVKLKTDSQLRLDIYSLKPPTRIKTKVLDWSETLSKNNEYALVLNNCYATANGKYQIEITVR